ncbi:MAG: DUF2358 domain-containing protein [Moorea sp. SIO1F2]|uniref:DUF2358 domain-containing protein n=1 Tax=unclassified Moorena TaxID=2683338 RepID=UPI0013B8BC0C|nr:DUF2358 domain-containing protein [Moorena sp. SIO3I6]NET82196.1 DUF2358 domain-containing protein [Moorena sp. SIO1F2]
MSRFKVKLNYRIIVYILRFNARLFFSTIYFVLHDISQTDEKVITANWTGVHLIFVKKWVR